MSRSPPPVAVALLLAATLIGCGLRLVALDRQVLWHDEVYTRIFAAGNAAHDWKPALFTGAPIPVAEVLAWQRPRGERTTWDTVVSLAHDEPQHPPLYYVALRGWVSLFGSEIGALRALSATGALGLPPAMAALAWALFRDRRVAWTAAALAASSPFFHLYAREAREYILWAVLSVASTAALVEADRRSDDSPPPVGWWAAYAVLTATSLYTAFSATGVVAAHVAWLILTHRSLRPPAVRYAIASLAVAGALFAPWAVAIGRQWEAFQVSTAWMRAVQVPRAELISTFALHLSRAFVDFWPDLASSGAPVGVLAALALLGWGTAQLRRAPPPAATLLVLLIAAPIALTLLPDLWGGGIRSLSTRYFTVALAAVLLIAAWGLGTARGRLGGALTAAVVAVGLASSAWDTHQVAPWSKGVSVGLPTIAAHIAAAPRPVVVGNMERHHPGNLLALCDRLPDDAIVQFVPPEVRWSPPPGDRPIFLFSPIPPQLDEARALGLKPVRLFEDVHASLWRIDRPVDAP